MALTVTENAFTTEKEALAEIARMGWYAAALDLVSEASDSAEMTQPINKPVAG
jgi:hypothetical protein